MLNNYSSSKLPCNIVSQTTSGKSQSFYFTKLQNQDLNLGLSGFEIYTLRFFVYTITLIFLSWQLSFCFLFAFALKIFPLIHFQYIYFKCFYTLMLLK